MQLTLYLTAGFPNLETTRELIDLIGEYPVKAIELGIPYSDPLADGPAIQAASQSALDQGISLERIFQELDFSSEQEMYLMGYLNPFYKYGFDPLLKAMKERDVMGTIIPDLPLAHYDKHLIGKFQSAGIGQSFLVTPETTQERVELLAEKSSCFLYAVSRSATTGGSFQFTDATKTYLANLEKWGVKDKVRVGFGISSKETAKPYVDLGWDIIIGSAFVKAIQSKGVDGARAFLDGFF